MKALNRTSGLELAGDLTVADSLIARMKGLLGKNALPSGKGLWIRPCMGVHTFGMKFPIDVIFLDKNKRVLALAKALCPNRVSRHYSRASSVIELPAGTIDATRTVTGDHIEFA